MALCLSDFKGYFQMVNLKMENVAYEYEDFGIQEDKKKKQKTLAHPQCMSRLRKRKLKTF